MARKKKDASTQDSQEASGEKPGVDKAKRQALEAALGQIQKKCGAGSIMRLGQNVRVAVESISTGSLAVDVATGIGGIPRGRVTEIYGPESSGKTTLALTTIATAQRKGGTAAFIDAEHALDPAYARKLGVDLDQLLVSQPDSGEQALEIAEMLISSNAVDIVVIDSVAALVPKAELEGDMGGSFVGLHARLMSQALRKLTGLVFKTNTAVIFINQLREKIGVMFGSPEVTTGGRALKFYASLRIDIRRISTMKDSENAGASRVKAKIVKNKCAPPFKTAEFEIHFSKGISRTADILDFAVEFGLVDQAGAWFSRKGERLGQGRDKVILLLEEKPELLKEIEAEVLERIVPTDGTPAVAPERDPADEGAEEEKAAEARGDSDEDGERAETPEPEEAVAEV